MTKSGLDKAILIAGPTASGKSGIALALARELGAVVINADAMQVYRDLRILTARPDEAAMAEVPHWLYGHVDAGLRYSAGRWLGEARAVLDDVAQQGRWAVVTGGTGFYFKALTEGLADIPAIDPRITEALRVRLAAEGASALHADLRRADLLSAEAIQPSDGQRLVRALSVLQATGKPLRAFHGGEAEPPAAGTPPHRLVISPERSSLNRQIEVRFDAMVGEGALDEVEALMVRQLDRSLPAMKAIGVGELARHLAGEASLDEAIAEAKTRTRRFAKRQMTWIRGQMVGWEVAPGPEEAIARLRRMAAF